MRTLVFLAFFQMILSAISAWLISQMSFIGKLGIGLFYKEYKILKSPIETGILIFALQMFVVILLFICWRFISNKATRIVSLLVIFLACIGLAYTIHDFTYEFSHRILKSKFHTGFYLIWAGMIISALIYLFIPARIKQHSI
ncbi:MAG: hypothetical protein Q4G27_03335 [Flavobacteriaceae bacterium]|nr:hypothetical protein [Flavobacteriaceae bacterium]